MTATMSVHVEAPVSAVFELFRNPACWQGAAKGVEFEEVHVTREGFGTHYFWRAKVVGIPVHGFGVYTEFVPERKITDISSLSIEGTWTYTFAAEGSGTRLTLANRVRGPWRLPLVQTLLDQWTLRNHGPTLERLKEQLERGADSATGARLT